MTGDREISELRTAMEIVIQMIAVAYVASSSIYFAMCLLLDRFVMDGPGGFLEMSGINSAILFVAGLVTAFGAAYGACWIRDLPQKQWAKNLAANLFAVYISMSIAETGAIFGLVLFLSSGHLVLAAILMMISTAAKIRIFPSRRWLRDQ